jgi:hypothetical protein
LALLTGLELAGIAIGELFCKMIKTMREELVVNTSQIIRPLAETETQERIASTRPEEFETYDRRNACQPSRERAFFFAIAPGMRVASAR